MIYSIFCVVVVFVFTLAEATHGAPFIIFQFITVIFFYYCCFCISAECGSTELKFLILPAFNFQLEFIANLFIYLFLFVIFYTIKCKQNQKKFVCMDIVLSFWWAILNR